MLTDNAHKEYRIAAPGMIVGGAPWMDEAWLRRLVANFNERKEASYLPPIRIGLHGDTKIGWIVSLRIDVGEREIWARCLIDADQTLPDMLHAEVGIDEARLYGACIHAA